jgi:tungstate transport system substrate-binding protein
MSASPEACMPNISAVESLLGRFLARGMFRVKLKYRFAFLAIFAAFAFSAAPAQNRLRMSTTTSTENSGLLNVLLPPFEKHCKCKVDVIAVGTGKALMLGEAGDVDVVLVHARALEDKFVADGYGVNRRDVMYNDFVIIGPADDPAGVKRASSAADAFKLIASKQSSFISRGDDSGTHQKEKEIWAASATNPAGQWYRSVGQGMGEVINMATELRAYTLADRGTYNAFRHGKTDLVILFEGSNTYAKEGKGAPRFTVEQVRAQTGAKGLFNPYGVIAVNPKKIPQVEYGLAMKFIEYVTGIDGQRIIANYQVQGDPVFFTYKEK